MGDYKPELGQILFGQPPKEYACSDMLDAALTFIRHRLDTVLWNRLQKEVESPFGNTGSRFDTDGLSIHSYSWSDDDQPYNFKCGDVEVSWYKYLGRGMSANADYSPSDVSSVLSTALSILDRVDNGEQDFTYA